MAPSAKKAPTQPVLPTKYLWEQPPPHPLDALPRSDPCRDMDLKEYMDFCKKPASLYKVAAKDEELKKVVLSEIEKFPVMWSAKNTTNQAKYYALVGVETYKRTGKILGAKSITTIFKFAKDAIRNRLRAAISNKRLSNEEIEEHLWRWNFYGFIRFYRRNLINWEIYMKRQVNSTHGLVYTDCGTAEGGEVTMPMEEDDVSPELTIDYASPELDDIEILEASVVQPKIHPIIHPIIKQEVKQEDVVYMKDVKDEDLGPLRQTPPAQYSPYYEQYGMQQPYMMQNEYDNQMVHQTSSSSMNSRPTPPPPPPVPQTDFEHEMTQISYQAIRVAREQPERVKLLRKCLFDVILAFDDKAYESAGAIFKDLAAKHN